jgi:hypothetical protein
LAIVLVVVIQGGSQLLWAPGTKNVDQSVLFAYFTYAHLIELVGVVQSNVPVDSCILRPTATN